MTPKSVFTQKRGQEVKNLPVSGLIHNLLVNTFPTVPISLRSDHWFPSYGIWKLFTLTPWNDVKWRVCVWPYLWAISKKLPGLRYIWKIKKICSTIFRSDKRYGLGGPRKSKKTPLYQGALWPNHKTYNMHRHTKLKVSTLAFNLCTKYWICVMWQARYWQKTKKFSITSTHYAKYLENYPKMFWIK